MNEYKAKFTSHTKSFVIVIWLIDCVFDIAEEYFRVNNDDIVIRGILSAVQALLIAAAFLFLWRRLSAGESGADKLKLLPFALLPYGAFVAVSTAIGSLFFFVPDTMEWYYYAAISVITDTAALLFGLLYLVKWSGNYAPLYAEKHTLVFPPEYRLRGKWWFSLVALIISTVFMSIITVVLPFIATEHYDKLSGVSSVLYEVLFYALLVLLFNSAFKSIDKDTRRIFHPVILTASAIISLISTALSYVSLKLSEVMTELVGELEGIMQDLNNVDIAAVMNIYKQLALPFLGSLILLAGEVLAYYTVYRCLKAYDYIPAPNKGE